MVAWDWIAARRILIAEPILPMIDPHLPREFIAGVPSATRLEASSRQWARRSCRKDLPASPASRDASLVLRQSSKTSVLLPWLRSWRRIGPLATVTRWHSVNGESVQPGQSTRGDIFVLSAATTAFGRGSALTWRVGASMTRRPIQRMRIGYAPAPACAAICRDWATTIGRFVECGLIDPQGRDCFFRCLSFPLPRGGSLHGRAIEAGAWRHRFLPTSKGGLYGGSGRRGFPA